MAERRSGGRKNHFDAQTLAVQPFAEHDTGAMQVGDPFDYRQPQPAAVGALGLLGRDDYVNPIFIDATWGVSDQDMFNRALDEVDRLDSGRPFYAILQTLSNHTPYALPENLPVEPVTGFGNLDEHLTAQRYSGWGLGQFFASAAKKPWFNEALFVIVGDCGFGLGRQLSDVGLLRFHVPLLLLGPGIQTICGTSNHTVAAQTDVVPTAVSLLGKPFVHQCWGRGLLALPENDPGLGIAAGEPAFCRISA